MVESTADIHTREKSNVVVSIWEQVASRLPDLNLRGKRKVLEDLNHPDWDDQGDWEEHVGAWEPLAPPAPDPPRRG